MGFALSWMKNKLNSYHHIYRHCSNPSVDHAVVAKQFVTTTVAMLEQLPAFNK